MIAVCRAPKSVPGRLPFPDTLGLWEARSPVAPGWAAVLPRPAAFSFGYIRSDVWRPASIFLTVQNVGMIQRRGRFRLADETLTSLCVLKQVRRQKLERDIAVGLRILGLVDHTHRGPSAQPTAHRSRGGSTTTRDSGKAPTYSTEISLSIL